jgi:hypothetical protein
LSFFLQQLLLLLQQLTALAAFIWSFLYHKQAACMVLMG